VSWVPLIAWLAAVGLAVIVLGFCGYEIAWKSRRLLADLALADELAGRLEAVREQADTVQRRLAAARTG
jgi:hypothetical protein